MSRSKKERKQLLKARNRARKQAREVTSQAIEQTTKVPEPYESSEESSGHDHEDFCAECGGSTN